MSAAKGATRSHHPARRTEASTPPSPRGTRVVIPRDVETVELQLGRRSVHLTNLGKPFWPALGLTKRDLLQYYADVAGALLPHLHDRARYEALRTGPRASSSS
jgi:bifunctional non-homologous end joining protein LigD